jgi:hypothetical protein
LGEGNRCRCRMRTRRRRKRYVQDEEKDYEKNM